MHRIEQKRETRLVYKLLNNHAGIKAIFTELNQQAKRTLELTSLSLQSKEAFLNWVYESARYMASLRLISGAVAGADYMIDNKRSKEWSQTLEKFSPEQILMHDVDNLKLLEELVSKTIDHGIDEKSVEEQLTHIATYIAARSNRFLQASLDQGLVDSDTIFKRIGDGHDDVYKEFESVISTL